jgi:PAS domain S-box-containing protein
MNSPSFGARNLPTYRVVGATWLVLIALTATAALLQQGMSGQLLPHAFCISASEPLLYLHLVSDSLIALAYLLIPAAILRFSLRRHDLPFGWVAWVFGAFIVACGTTHAMEVWTLYYPAYWYSGVVKAFTALVSLATAWLIWRLTPTLLSLPSAEDLRLANRALETEIESRRSVELQLRSAKAEVEALLTSTRKRAVKEIEEERAQLLALANNISQLAWMADSDGSVSWYNRRWFDYTGTVQSDMEGWGWRAVHHPDHVQRVEEKFRRHITTGQPWEDTFPLRGADGDYRWFLSRAFPLYGGDGAIVRWFGTNTDVTEQLQAQEALREADRRKDEFIATLAHELRNPLAPVRNAAEVLTQLPNTDARAERMTGVIQRQVTHMARLLDDLLDVARIARGQLLLKLEACDLGEIAMSTVRDYRETIEAAGIQLVMQAPLRPLPIRGDPVRLAQAIGNYLQNAIRFARGSNVTVNAFADDETGEGVVTVSDTGAGISPELLRRLFVSFAQADQGLARNEGGLGLGLALTRGLTELHGGRVLAHSEGEGRGATFELRIPLSGVVEMPPQGRTPSEGTQAHARILVIEDNHDSADTLALVLEAEGYEVRVAYEAESGLAEAAGWLPDIVISDLGLPGPVNGYGVARALRASAATADVRLLALSGYANSESVQRAHAAGFDGHLRKPVDLKDLLQWIGTPNPG